MTDDKLIRNWNYAHAGLIASALAVTFLANELFIFLFAGIISFCVYIMLHLKYLKEVKPFGGYANWVTFSRILFTFLLGFSYLHLPDYQILFISLFIVVLDGADGYLARKYNTQSAFGAFFDLETDAYFVALMSLILYKKEYIDFWIVIPGFLRYFYVLFLLLIGFNRRKEKKLKFAQVIAVLFFISLLSPFILPYALYHPILIIVSVLIVISFSYSFYSLMNDES